MKAQADALINVCNATIHWLASLAWHGKPVSTRSGLTFLHMRAEVSKQKTFLIIIFKHDKIFLLNLDFLTNLRDKARLLFESTYSLRMLGKY